MHANFKKSTVRNGYTLFEIGGGYGLGTINNHCANCYWSGDASSGGIFGRPASERAYLLLVVGYPTDSCEVPAITKKSFEDIANFVGDV